MPKTALRKEKWTLSFDSKLKSLLIREARRRDLYPVQLIEQIVRDRLNPYGHTKIKNSAAYVRKIRGRSRARSDAAFLKEIREWQRLNS